MNVDGGPLNPQCPVGDTCPPEFNGYAGDIEVDADIETQLAIAPDVSHLIVYNAPNDFTGQTELDEWSAIAKANVADSVSSSWAVCENDVDRRLRPGREHHLPADGRAGAERVRRPKVTPAPSRASARTAHQRQPSRPARSALGDRVGGTSFENFNPGTNPHPRYPRVGEAVWNLQNLCSNAAASPANDNQGGFFWCAADRSRRRRVQPVLGHALVPEGPRGHQLRHHRR